MTIFLLTVLWFVLGILAFQLVWSANINEVKPRDVWFICAGPILLIMGLIAIRADSRRSEDSGDGE